MFPTAIKDRAAKGLQRPKALSLLRLSLCGSSPPDTGDPSPSRQQPLTIVGPRTQILITAIDTPLAAAGLVAALGAPSLGRVAGATPQELGQLVTQCATVPAKIQCLPVTFVHAQGGRGIGARPAGAQALHGAQAEQPVSGDPLPALGRKTGIAGWGDSDLPTLGLQAALQSMAEDEEDVGLWKGRQDMKPSQGLSGLDLDGQCHLQTLPLNLALGCEALSHTANHSVLTPNPLRWR